MTEGDAMQAAEYRRFYFGSETCGEGMTEIARLPKIDADWCGPELTTANWGFENRTVTIENQKSYSGNRHERRKAAAIDRAWEKRRKKEAKP